MGQIRICLYRKVEKQLDLPTVRVGTRYEGDEHEDYA
jgi:hypothetical protein